MSVKSNGKASYKPKDTKDGRLLTMSVGSNGTVPDTLMDSQDIDDMEYCSAGRQSRIDSFNLKSRTVGKACLGCQKEARPRAPRKQRKNKRTRSKAEEGLCSQPSGKRRVVERVRHLVAIPELTQEEGGLELNMPNGSLYCPSEADWDVYQIETYLKKSSRELEQLLLQDDYPPCSQKRMVLEGTLEVNQQSLESLDYGLLPQVEILPMEEEEYRPTTPDLNLSGSSRCQSKKFKK